ncbi:MAG TPA: diaminopimelate epimerase [Thermoanaerobaculia bacterium]|jgi:diaminopimelate epimerase
MTRFHKVSGSGNDFLALAEPSQVPPPGTIRAWCRRGVSLGADGLFVLRRGGPATATMDYFNADGFPANLCLNGTRCAAQLAFHLGWAEGEVRVRTGAGTFSARRLDAGRVAIDLPVPAEEPRPLSLEIPLASGDTATAGFRILVGVPHFVLPWPEGLANAPVRELGRAIRYHPAFEPAGTNVNFVRFPETHRMEIRTYERGVEDETLSCGTGVLAGAAVGLATGGARLPLHVTTQGGFQLEVDGDLSTGRWSLAGDARVVAEGEMLPGALASPVPPPWAVGAPLAGS